MKNHSSAKRIFGAVPLLIFALLISAAAVYVCRYAINRKPVSLIDIGNPEDAVVGYFDALLDEEYETCDKYVMDFSIAEMQGEPESELGKMMHTLLTDSYEYKLISNSDVSGKEASVLVEVSYMDFDLLGEAMKKKANAIAAEMNYHGEDIFSEDIAMEIAFEALKEVECSVSDFCISESITVSLVYDGSEWKMLYNEALENMLMGND